LRYYLFGYGEYIEEMRKEAFEQIENLILKYRHLEYSIIQKALFNYDMKCAF
jgi:hypothetical protein